MTRLLVALLLLAPAGACRRDTPSHDADDAGSADTPRIVALSPAIAQTLRDLGFDHLIVGRHGWDQWSDQTLPVCGDQSGIDYEALIRVDPTHVILQWGQRDLPPRLIELARDRGWELRNFELLTLDGIEACVAALCNQFGRFARSGAQNGAPVPARAPESADPPCLTVLDEMSRAWSRRDSLDPARIGRVLLLDTADPPAAFGPGSFHQQILDRLGASPAILDGAPYIALSAEDVVRLAPDAIIIFRPGPPDVIPNPRSIPSDELESRLGVLGRLVLPAVRNGKVAIIDDTHAVTPGTPMIAIADQMAEILQAWSAPAEGRGSP